MVKIKIITGSTRPGRFNEQVAKWVYEQAQKQDGAQYELVDLAEVNLPFLDEPKTPSQGDYQNEHTKKWAEVIGGSDGFVLVTPEYNHSTSAVLKNALDYLAAEWFYKPVTFVSYGSQAGGARAVEHLRGIAGELRMYDLREQLLLLNYWDNLNEKGQYQFTDQQAAALGKQLQDLTFWAEQMKTARQQLPA